MQAKTHSDKESISEAGSQEKSCLHMATEEAVKYALFSSRAITNVSLAIKSSFFPPVDARNHVNLLNRIEQSIHKQAISVLNDAIPNAFKK